MMRLYAVVCLLAITEPLGAQLSPPPLRFDSAAQYVRDGDSRYWFGRSDGGAYRIVSDREGYFAKDSVREPIANNYLGLQSMWSVYCGEDAMDDVRSCSVTQRPVAIRVGASTGLVVIGGRNAHLYPGSRLAIRFGEGAVVSGPVSGWRGQIATSLVNRMAAATRVRVRYVDWPSGAAMDDELDPGGLAAALRFARQYVRLGESGR
jgi:hypothetical protein